MFSKVLVANRGEIAIRAFRAAYEVGARTVAVFPYEDRWSEHRLKADEAYEIGERGHPVRAYLDPDAIVAVAVRAGRRRGLPGLRLPVENPALAEACANAGITFIGPTSEVLTLTGNKARAIAAAKAAGVPTLASVEPVAPTSTRWSRRPRRCRYPLFVKAVAGGGGRGMRRVDDPEGPPRRGRDLHARGRGRLRRPDRLHRAGGRRPAPHRGADPRRRRGQRDPPLRARLLGAAPPPEGRSRSRRRRTSTPSCGTGCAPTPSGSPPRSATATPAPSSSCSTPTATTSSSR